MSTNFLATLDAILLYWNYSWKVTQIRDILRHMYGDKFFKYGQRHPFNIITATKSKNHNSLTRTQRTCNIVAGYDNVFWCTYTAEMFTRTRKSVKFTHNWLKKHAWVSLIFRNTLARLKKKLVDQQLREQLHKDEICAPDLRYTPILFYSMCL